MPRWGSSSRRASRTQSAPSSRVNTTGSAVSPIGDAYPAVFVALMPGMPGRMKAAALLAALRGGQDGDRPRRAVLTAGHDDGVPRLEVGLGAGGVLADGRAAVERHLLRALAALDRERRAADRLQPAGHAARA